MNILHEPPGSPRALRKNLAPGRPAISVSMVIAATSALDQQISPISGGPFSSERPRVQFWIEIEAIAQRATPIRFVVLEMDDHPIEGCFM